MTTLMKAHHQWASRPADERFLSLDEMHANLAEQRSRSRALTLSSRQIEARPVEDDMRSLVMVGPDGAAAAPTHFSFGQVAQLAGAPAGYLRKLPSPLVADCINYGMKSRSVEEIGALLRGGEGLSTLAAATGPNYGRIWNVDVVAALRNRFGNGLDGQFTVPGEFGQKVDVTRDNTTLYASDRDMFVFLADEQNRIELPNRRNGRTGELSRGFFVWNSEVGDKTLGIATFLFDYVCSNRMVWGASDVQEIRVRHTISAPDKFVEEVVPAVEAYAKKSTAGIRQGIEDARSKRFDDGDQMMEFLRKRFTKGQAEAISLAHIADEDRPIETLWDAAVGITAYARGMQYQDQRVDMERAAGKIMALAK